MEIKAVQPSHEDSYESVFHGVDAPGLMLGMRHLLDSDLVRQLTVARLERAIGVIYRPETERKSHYFGAKLSKQFDVILHFDETRAVEPLEKTVQWLEGELPESYPSGI